jgi:hypothetical protein
MRARRKCHLKTPESENLVEAELIDELSKDDLIQAHLDWAPVRLAALKRLHEAKQPWPEHWHWDWSKKADMLDLLAYRCTGIEMGGRMQGMMMVSTIAAKGRLPGQQGKAVLYVEFLETAPWNIRDLAGTPQFLGVGVRLLEAAIVFSEEEGFGGRIGLHSLPQSADFYRKYMTDLGLDASQSQGLRYFEMSAEQVRYFLEGRKP